MVKQLTKGKERLRNAYWSMVGMASVAMLSLQPVMADTIWDRFSTILQDIYGQVYHTLCAKSLSFYCHQHHRCSYSWCHCAADPDDLQKSARSGRSNSVA